MPIDPKRLKTLLSLNSFDIRNWSDVQLIDVILELRDIQLLPPNNSDEALQAGKLIGEIKSHLLSRINLLKGDVNALKRVLGVGIYAGKDYNDIYRGLV
jgi:hypothetical protein